MSGYFQFDNSNAGGGGPFNIYRGQLDQAGMPVYTEQTFDDYKIPPAGQYRMKLTGFAEPQEVENTWEGKTTTKNETKLEIEITDGPGKGHKFIVSWVTFSLGDRANAFHLYVATMCDGDKKKAPMQRVWDDMIGKEFMGYVTNPKMKDDGTPARAGLSWDTLAPVKEGSAAYDPFNTDNKDVA